jgi:hypothetical protein
MTNWVSVKDRLPEKEGIYLTFGEPFGIKTEYYWIANKEWESDLYDSISHWMPLPSPPENISDK